VKAIPRVAQRLEHCSGNDGKPSTLSQIRGHDGREPVVSSQISRQANGGLSRDTAGVGSSNLPPRTKFYVESIGLPECPYLRRWVADFGLFSIRLHRWQSSDDARHFHDHPWWFLTLVLRGRYVDVSPDGRDQLRPGSIRYRPALHKHTVEVQQPGTWTLLITGPTERRWGFWVNDKMIRRDKYFAVHGHHPCDASGEPVRMSPDGERLRA
jgi:hypothetical protein